MGIEQEVNIKGRTARIAMTPQCNMKCEFCEGMSGFKPGKPGSMEDFRRNPLEAGNIETNYLLQIINASFNAGFDGITLTGGEPTINPKWDFVIEESAKMGIKRAEITTNGLLLKAYLEEKGSLPKGLSLVKISLTTSDPDKFKRSTGGADLNRVLEGVNAVQKLVKTRANKVVLRSDLNQIEEYLEFVRKIGFKEVLLLDLVFHPNRDNKNDALFFQKQYVSAEELANILEKKMGIVFDSDKYGHQAQDKDFRIILKDSNLTLRNDTCSICPIYCQEGLYTIRISTDGNITLCPDFKAQLSSVDAVKAIKENSLSRKMIELVKSISTAKNRETLVEFMKKHNLSFSS